LLRLVYRARKDFNPEVFNPIRTGKLSGFLRRKLDKPDLACPPELSIPAGIVAIPSLEFSNRGYAIHAKDGRGIDPAVLRLDTPDTRTTSGKVFNFDAHLRIFWLAINGRKFNLPYADYLVGADELTEKLAKSHAADFGLGKEDELIIPDPHL
jgi:hypothetical protein